LKKDKKAFKKGGSCEKEDHFSWPRALISPNNNGKRKQHNLCCEGNTWGSPSQTHFYICSALTATLQWAYVGSEEKGSCWFLCNLCLGYVIWQWHFPSLLVMTSTSPPMSAPNPYDVLLAT